MNEEIKIRTAVESDAGAVAKIELFTSASPWSETALRNDILDSENVIVLVAVDEGTSCDGEFRDELSGGRIVGYADARIVVGEAQLNNIALVEAYQGRQIGELLMQEMLNRVADSCESINLEVRKSNKRAIRLYEKMGFEKDGCRRAYYEDNGEDAVLMSRSI